MQRAVMRGLFLCGVLLIGLGATGALDRLAYYVLPLGYATWVGLCLVVVAVCTSASVFFGRGRYRYVREGVAAPARVTALAVKSQDLDGHGAFFSLAVEFEMKHPETGKVDHFSATSAQGASNPKRWSAVRLAPGDYVTAVYLPSAFPKSLTLFPLLELTDASSVIEPRRGGSALPAVIIAAIFGALFATGYGVEFYLPIGEPTSFFLAVPACTVLIAVPAWIVLARLKRASKLAVLGLFVFGCLASAGGLSIANARLDSSPPEYTLVKIREFWQTTHDFVFRDYSIEYEDPVTKEKVKVAATAEQMDRFVVRAGALETHAGRLGWKWIRQVHPVVNTYQVEGGGVRAEIELDDGRRVQLVVR